MRRSGIKSIAVFGLLIVAMFAIAAPAQAVQDLRITDYNLNTLNSFTYSGAWHNIGADSYLVISEKLTFTKLFSES